MSKTMLTTEQLTREVESLKKLLVTYADGDIQAQADNRDLNHLLAARTNELTAETERADKLEVALRIAEKKADIFTAHGNGSKATGRTFTPRPCSQTTIRRDYLYLIQDVIPQRGLALLIAEYSKGKTFSAIDLGMAVARNTPWHDSQHVTPGTVLYVSGEGSIENRVAAYLKHHKIEPSTIPFFTIEDTVDLFNVNADLAPLIAAATAISPQLIILDTLNALTPGSDENSGQDMGTVIAHARKLMKETGAAVLILHHLGKNLKMGARGHSSLNGTIDAGLRIDSPNDKDFTLSVYKQRNEKKGRKFGFRLEVVDLGLDLNGQPLTSCVTVPQQATGAAGDFAINPKSVTGKALTVLQDLTLSGLACPQEAWFEEFATRHYPDNRHTARKVFNRAYESLIETERIVENEGQVYLNED